MAEVVLTFFLMFVISAVAVRFVFPAVSAEGHAFWIVRTSPVGMRSFLWSKFWTGLLPILILAEGLTVVSNELLGVGPFLRVLAAVAIAAAVAVSLARPWQQVAVRVAGSWVAAMGLLMIGWFFRGQL